MPRLGLGLVLGLVITLFLFWFMQYMIETADRTLDEGSRGSLVDFVRVQRDEAIERRQLKPKKPPPPDAPPPQPPTPQLDNLDPTAEKIAISAVPVSTEIEMTGGFSLGVGEGDYLPIVKVAPIYPQRALTRGVEGFCVVEYTVTRQGTIREPFVVEDQCTSSLFHRASLQAALKFKYKPRIIDGEAVEVRGVQNKFTYEITE
ncbi:MAG: energy transducer TonB [Xanthomonadales bacterium]|nr:energy transducer TonB [Gammaproteobacteria bacterium]NNE05221.1 energy transducer TonB [Xanthomonadales bacterium]NNL95721.1 energy transducer TonB [Xanthomonadales bacterium]